MTVLQWPAEARIKSNDLSLIYPGQVALQSPYTGERQVINRSPGLWSGTVRIMEVSYRNAAAIRAVESMLAQLRGQENIIEIPLNRGTFDITCQAVFYVDPADNKLYQYKMGEGEHVKISDRDFSGVISIEQFADPDKIVMCTSTQIYVYNLLTDGTGQVLDFASFRGPYAIVDLVSSSDSRRGCVALDFGIAGLRVRRDIRYDADTNAVDLNLVTDSVTNVQAIYEFDEIGTYVVLRTIGAGNSEIYIADAVNPANFGTVYTFDRRIPRTNAASRFAQSFLHFHSSTGVVVKVDIGTPYVETAYTLGKSNVQAMCADRRHESNQNCGITVASTAFVEGRLKTTFNRALTMNKGDYLRIGDRLYNYVESADAGTSAFLYPQAVPADGAMVKPAPTVRARLSDEQPAMMAKNPDFAGPWTLNWVEAI